MIHFWLRIDCGDNAVNDAIKVSSLHLHNLRIDISLDRMVVCFHDILKSGKR